MVKNISQRNLQAHLKTAQATAIPNFLKELAKATQERILNFFQRFK